MPQLPYRCDNYNHCHNNVEQPGLCRSCKQEAKRLTAKVRNVWKQIEQKGKAK